MTRYLGVNWTARRLTVAAMVAAISLPLSPPLQGRQSDGASDDITYVIKAGDTLSELDYRYLSGADAEASVARLNHIGNPRRIPIGKVMRLPRRLLAYSPLSLTISGFSGPVQVDGQIPTVGMRLAEGQVVQTGQSGFVSFRGSDGSTVSMPSNSRARLDRARVYRLDNLRDVSFSILKGRGEISVPGLKGQERFRSGTPMAVTAVRGTVFRISYDEANTTSLTEVVEGTVSVTTENREAIAPAGFGVAASMANDLGEPDRLLPPPQIADPGRVQTDLEVQFALTPVENAAGARTQIARDAGFLEIIAEGIGSEPVASFVDVENGRFFVRSRSIASSGLEGLSDTYSFRRKRLGVSASVEQSPLEDAYKFAWVSVGEGTVLNAFQLWREDTREQMLVDELAPAKNAILLSGLEPGVYLWRVAAMQMDEGQWLKVWGPEQRLIVTE